MPDFGGTCCRHPPSYPSLITGKKSQEASRSLDVLQADLAPGDRKSEGRRKAKVVRLEINMHDTQASLTGLRHEPEPVSPGSFHRTKEVR